VVHHLNLARGELKAPEARRFLVECNHRAGLSAKGAAAPELALSYFTVALELLGEERWVGRYAQTLALSAEAAEAAFLCAEYERTESLVTETCARAQGVLDTVRAQQVRISARLAQNQPMEAIRIGLSVLERLGMRFAEHPSRLRLLWTVMRARARLWKRTDAEILALPRMADPRADAAISIMRSIAAALFQSEPALMTLVVCAQVDILLGRGHNAWSSSVLASFGILLGGALGDIGMAHRLGRLALLFMERQETDAQKARTLYLYSCFQAHCKEPLSTTLPLLRQACAVGQETGDLEYAAFSAHVFCQHAFFLGMQLNDLDQEMESYLALIAKLKQRKQLGYSQIFRQAVLNLLGQCENPTVLDGELFDEAARLQELAGCRDGSGLFAVHFLEAMLCCLFRRYPEALAHADEARKWLTTVRGMFAHARFLFYDSLACLGASSASNEGRARLLLRRVRENQRLLGKRAAHAPENHLHLYFLIEAEGHRLRGQDTLALTCYDRAIALAEEHRFGNDLALAHELIAVFYHTRGKELYFKAHLQEAGKAYCRWGAMAKVADLERTYSLPQA